MKLPVSYEIAAYIPLTGWSFLAFVQEYAPVINLTVGLFIAACTWYWRRKEHKKIMKEK